MKISRVVPATTRSLVIAVALALILPTQGGATNQHDAATHKLTLDNGKKWATDQALREGMTAIRDILALDLKSIGDASPPPAKLADIGKKIDTHVEYIVANCRLPAEADANLHIILMDIMAGSEAMQGKGDGISPAAGAEKITHALDVYITHFDHAGWKAFH